MRHLMLELFFDEMEFDLKFEIEEKIGSGKSKNGKRKSWKKKYNFELNLLKEKHHPSKYAGFTDQQLEEFFCHIKNNLIRPKETDVHAKNKLLMWLDRLHQSLTWNQVRDQYKISPASAIGYVDDVLNAILKTFRNTNIIGFPNLEEREKMVKILKKRNAPMPTALFLFDGKDALCNGQIHSERLSYKYRFLPCFSVLFVVERVFNTICAFNLDPEGKKHDITVLRESSFYYHLNSILDGWLVLADAGYKNEGLIAAAVKKNDKRKKKYSRSFWKTFNAARCDSERVFAHFFSNKFPLLANWKGKSKNTFNEWSLNVICCVILYNYFQGKKLLLNASS